MEWLPTHLQSSAAAILPKRVSGAPSCGTKGQSHARCRPLGGGVGVKSVARYSFSAFPITSASDDEHAAG
jgi:hypothetical protein